MEYFHMGPLETLGILFIFGYFGGRLANGFRFPRVTGYVIAGILLSPSISGFIPAQLVTEKFSVINDIALALIAYSVGGSLKFSKLQRLGKSIFIINLSETLGAFLLTFVLIAALSPYIVELDQSLDHFLEGYLPLALIIAAISAATAPAAILAIVHEYKARGPLTTTLLGVVALDDAMAIILFAFAGTMVRTLTEGTGISVYRMVAQPVLLILGSVVLGTIVGLLLNGLAPWVRKTKCLLVVILGATFLCYGIAATLGLSPLLANMMVGFFIVNKAKHSERLFQALENIEEPIFALFFTLAGTHFDIMVFKLVGLLALLIVICRFSGKLIGTRIGATLSGAPPVVKKYLGLGLLPTAGVTVGLVFMARPFMQSELFEVMVNAVLGAVIISEIVAPPLVKSALRGAGEDVRE